MFPREPHPTIIKKNALRKPRAKTEIKNRIHKLWIMQSYNSLFANGFQLFFCLIMDFCECVGCECGYRIDGKIIFIRYLCCF
jgi:hypothetical protein